jgi:hypothetical protein
MIPSDGACRRARVVDRGARRADGSARARARPALGHRVAHAGDARRRVAEGVCAGLVVRAGLTAALARALAGSNPGGARHRRRPPSAAPRGRRGSNRCRRRSEAVARRAFALRGAAARGEGPRRRPSRSRRARSRPDTITRRCTRRCSSRTCRSTTTPHGRLRAFRPRFDELCAELADAGVAETMQHDDLQGNSSFVAGAHSGSSTGATRASRIRS